MDTLKMPYMWTDFSEETTEPGKNAGDKDSSSLTNILLMQNLESSWDEQLTAHKRAVLNLSPFRGILDAWERIRLPMILLYWILRSMANDRAKRALDLTLCLLVLPLMLPLMMIVSLAIFLESGCPVIFKQQRIGKHGRAFYCYKFRSMIVNAEALKSDLMANNEADEVVFKIKEDPRITRVGRIIRKLSMDELPQIFNVIKGEMSWVGPRPPVPCEVQQYTIDQMHRLEVLPGITGLQQVSGRSDLEFKRWVELDIQYIREVCLLRDIEILFKTIPAVISTKGAY